MALTAIKLSVEIPYTWSTNLGLYSGSRYLTESKNMFFDSLFLNVMAVIHGAGYPLPGGYDDLEYNLTKSN